MGAHGFKILKKYKKIKDFPQYNFFFVVVPRDSPHHNWALVGQVIANTNTMASTHNSRPT